MPRGLSFSKSQRLTRAAEFARVRKEGAVTRGQFLSLAVLFIPALKGMRAGFVTSRKIGGAVVRNRVRRRLREIVRRHQRQLVEGMWIVIIAAPPAPRATSQALEDEWLRLAKRASILAA
jgi:ribonuclease P protein component